MHLTGEQFVQELMTKIEERSYLDALTKINYQKGNNTDSVGDGIDLYDWHDWYINAADYDESGISLYISSDYDELNSEENEIITINNDDIDTFFVGEPNNWLGHWFFDIQCHDKNKNLYIILKE